MASKNSIKSFFRSICEANDVKTDEFIDTFVKGSKLFDKSRW